MILVRNFDGNYMHVRFSLRIVCLKDYYRNYRMFLWIIYFGCFLNLSGFFAFTPLIVLECFSRNSHWNRWQIPLHQTSSGLLICKHLWQFFMWIFPSSCAKHLKFPLKNPLKCSTKESSHQITFKANHTLYDFKLRKFPSENRINLNT